jgi:23S rRNA pseudouridine2605 synthase
MKWFARGKLWDTPEQAQWAGKNLPGSGEKRGRDWRPGGEHTDPRDRFKKKRRDGGAPQGAARPFQGRPPQGGQRPWRDKPSGPPRDRPWRDKRAGGTPSDAPGKPSGAPGKPSGVAQVFRPAHKPRGDRPWSGKPTSGPPRGDRPWSGKPTSGPPRRDRPWSGKPTSGPPRRDRPWSAKPPSGPPRDWTPGAPKRRVGDEPPTRRQDTPGTPPASEQIVTKPKPPERG